MFLGELLQVVIVEIAAQAHGGQDEDLPIGQSRSAVVAVCRRVDVSSDEGQNLVTACRVAVQLLQGDENGNDRVATGGVDGHVGDVEGVECWLGRERGAHGEFLAKMTGETAEFTGILAPVRSFSRGKTLFSSEKNGRIRFSDGHSLS